MLALAITVLLFALIGIGLPVGVCLALSGSLGLFLVGGVDIPLGILKTSPLSTVSSYELITVPMFLLMAEFVVLSGVADSMFRAATVWVGRLPGGLGIATALAGAGFGAISGSSTASAATLSSTTVPALLNSGYDPKMACGIAAVSGTLAMLIPPSIALVLYGIIADLNIGSLLIAGVVPGILVTLTICLTILYLVFTDPRRAPPTRSYSLREKLDTLKAVGPMVILFGWVTGSIYAGIATPTEASALGAFGAFLLAASKGKINRSSLIRTVAAAVQTTCMIIFVIIGANIFGYFFSITRVPPEIVAFVNGLGMPSWMVLVLILTGYFLLGFILDQIAILILTVPVVLPVITALGYDPIWFGVIVVVLAEVGLLTPPVGLNVFVIARYTGRPLEEIFSGVWPHVIAHLMLLAILCALPQLVLWLPSHMH